MDETTNERVEFMQWASTFYGPLSRPADLWRERDDLRACWLARAALRSTPALTPELVEKIVSAAAHDCAESIGRMLRAQYMTATAETNLRIAIEHAIAEAIKPLEGK